MRIGEILISCQLITASQLEEGLSYAGYKGIPIGRALRVLRILAEDDLSRGIEAQKAIRRGVDPRIALELVRHAREANRTFNYQLEHNQLALRNIPTVLIENILDKKFPRTLHDQLREMGAPMSMPVVQSGPPGLPIVHSQGQGPPKIEKKAAAPPPGLPIVANTPGTPPTPPSTAKPGGPPAPQQTLISSMEQTMRLPGNTLPNSGNTGPGQRPLEPTSSGSHAAAPLSAFSGPREPVLPMQDSKDGPRTQGNFDEMLEQADRHFAANELPQAERIYQKARILAEEQFGIRPSRVAIVLTKLANLYLATDRFIEAQPLYERVLEIHSKLFGAGSPQVTRANEDLSELFDLQSKPVEARRYMDAALKSFYQQERLDLEVGGRLLKRLMTITKKTGVSEQQARMRIGELAVDAMLITRDQLQQALQTSKQSGAPLGSVFRTMQALDSGQVESLMFAQLLIKQGTLPSLVAVHALRLAASRKVPLRQLLETGKLLTDKELNREQYQTLVLEQEKMLATEAKLGPDHLEVARIAQRIADMHLARKDLFAAELLYKRAISIMEKDANTRSEMARSCEQLADIFCQNGKFAEAQPLLFKSLEMRQMSGQGETREAANTLWQLARVELAQFNEATALSFLRTARSIFEKLQPGSTPTALLEQVAACCLDTGLTVDLEPILLQLIHLAHGDAQAFTTKAAGYAEALGDIYMGSARKPDAQTQFQMALQIFEKAGETQRVTVLTRKLEQANA